MARCWSHRCCWWLLLVVTTGLASAQHPQGSLQQLQRLGSTPRRLVLFLREQCHSELNVTAIVRGLTRDYAPALAVDMLPRDETCETRSGGLRALAQALGQKSTDALVASVDYNVCEVVTKLADLWNKTLVTWTCPQEQHDDSSLVLRLSPSPVILGRVLVKIFQHFRWKSISVIGVDEAVWSSLDRSVISAMRSAGIVARHHAVLQYNANPKQIRLRLRPLRSIPCRAIVICLPSESDLLSRTLVELDTMQESRVTGAVILVVHYFLAPWFSQPSFDAPSNGSGKMENNDQSGSLKLKSDEAKDESKQLGNGRVKVPQDLSRRTLANLLVVVPFDQKFDASNRSAAAAAASEAVDSLGPGQPTTLGWLRQSLDLLALLGERSFANRSWSSSQAPEAARLDSLNNRIFAHGLMGLGERPGEWRPLLVVSQSRDREIHLIKIDGVMGLVPDDSQLYDLLCDDQSDCDDQLEKISGVARDTTHIVFIIVGIIFILAIITTALMRRHLLKSRVTKGPCKIILTSTDFVFPQIPDARRVDEGLETMLGQWLQQLQEFGGPEVDKPDLLQGSLGSIRPNLQASNGNLARPFFTDPRARYNGDLVQLKQLPVQAAFELKGKAMDVLITIHGLRHENLNPLIGCLTESSRPCLVSEYCSRGSLEDVLVQDEIKLDWSFRLSLLTDLVRGMRYLHSTPIRAHGYLTSRNCVIDARWVLKITDYGLPAFYEAQNIQPPSKTARDLLWTAPELLRDEGLRKHGSQPGDVYSFGIIMQEVVVRGEPFCMLALSPEDIIEKVKRPPPLIRPSVSKGAAPPEAINIMRQCWAENEDMRPDFNAVHDLFKKLNHGRKVNIVDTMFQMLEKYSNNLEELIRERTEQLDMEKKKTEQLLNRMLPSSVAEKLKIGLPVDPEAFDEVTIYFSDIVGFTTISAYSTPFQVVDLLNDLYTCFDATINAYNVYKVETIGDAYMVVGGCPVRIPDHASQIATMALDLLHQSGKFRVRHLPKTPLRLRIGLHTGPCCAGVVGLTMPRYCLFGDTVNTASRMESTGAPWRIHLSQETRDRLVEVGGYLIEYRGDTELKGKGRMPTYWLLGKQDFDKELPVPPDLGEDHGLEETLILETLRPQEADPSSEPRRLQPACTAEDDVTCSVVPITTTITTTASARGLGRRAASCAAAGGSSPSLPARLARSEHSSMDRGPMAPPHSALPTIEGPGPVRRVPVSVHQEPASVVRGLQHYALGPSLSARSVLSVVAAVELAEAHPTHGETSESGAGVAAGSRSTPDYASSSVTKSTSGENAFSLGTPVSAAEVAAKLLCASTSSINLSSGHNLYRSRPRRSGVIEEDDLSMPYNHYRCLSPNEHYGSRASFEPTAGESGAAAGLLPVWPGRLGPSSARQQLARSRFASLDCSDIGAGGGASSSSGVRAAGVGARRTGGSFRHLRRQFSLDRADEPAQETGPAPPTASAIRPLLKQNSAGAASDLERIEEAPPTPATPVAPGAQQQQQSRAPQSLSVESLAQLVPPRP